MKTEILALIRETDGYVSGQELCEKFGVSRTAVWKAINQLKEAGYEIEAVQNKGYHLVSVPDILSESELQSVRKTKWIGEKIAFFDVVDSTNTRAKQLAEEGAPNGTYVIAERQDAGKGRRGRGFDSPAGQGIWMTLVLKPEIDLVRARCSIFRITKWTPCWGWAVPEKVKAAKWHSWQRRSNVADCITSITSPRFRVR